MTSLHRHLTAAASGHSRLPFRADCPLCAQQRTHGEPPGAELGLQRPVAALAAALTLAGAAPAPALAAGELPPAGDIAGDAGAAAPAYPDASEQAGGTTTSAPEPITDDSPAELPPAGHDAAGAAPDADGDEQALDTGAPASSDASASAPPSPAAPQPPLPPAPNPNPVPAPAPAADNTQPPAAHQAPPQPPADDDDAGGDRHERRTARPPQTSREPHLEAQPKPKPGGAAEPNQVEPQRASRVPQRGRSARHDSPGAQPPPRAATRPGAGSHDATTRELPAGARPVQADRIAPPSVERAPLQRRHVVESGDSLWLIAERTLGADRTPAAVAREVNRLWELNRHRLHSGSPDLIYPGEELEL